MNSPRVNGRREQSARDAGTEVPRWEAVGTDRVGGIAVNVNTYPDRNQTKGSDSPPWPRSNQTTSEGESKAPSDTLNSCRRKDFGMRRESGDYDRRGDQVSDYCHSSSPTHKVSERGQPPLMVD
jgi:hypothetical protein